LEKPKLPSGEDSRIEALISLNILDTLPEERFDRLTRMAKISLNTPIAVVSLVDTDRQWFKSSVGLDACETHRDISFCGHAIHSDEMLIVEDASKDERFANNPLVLFEPKIRFYAGRPLKAISGERLGTFCIIDTKPRALDQDEQVLLEDLGSMAERELSIVHLAINDDLTCIPNRRGFYLLGHSNLMISIRHGFSATLVYFDLDNFKSINDQYGHTEGDKVLITFAKYLKDTLRESDVCARIGGDEFVALLGNTTKTNATDFVSRLQKKIDVCKLSAKKGYKIQFSHGIIEYNSRKHNNLKALLKNGDELMFERKKAKKYNIVNINSTKTRL
jgi:diguanylate cyclase (GGDEF)-like protein